MKAISSHYEAIKSNLLKQNLAPCGAAGGQSFIKSAKVQKCIEKTDNNQIPYEDGMLSSSKHHVNAQTDITALHNRVMCQQALRHMMATDHFSVEVLSETV